MSENDAKTTKKFVRDQSPRPQTGAISHAVFDLYKEDGRYVVQDHDGQNEAGSETPPEAIGRLAAYWAARADPDPPR